VLLGIVSKPTCIYNIFRQISRIKFDILLVTLMWQPYYLPVNKSTVHSFVSVLFKTPRTFFTVLSPHLILFIFNLVQPTVTEKGKGREKRFFYPLSLSKYALTINFIVDLKATKYWLFLKENTKMISLSPKKKKISLNPVYNN